MNKLKLFYLFMDSNIRKKALSVSFDVTNRCNLRCIDCYWLTHKHYPEMSLEEIKRLFINLRKEGIIHCTYAGGEPTLREDVIKECTKIIPYNWIVTNGIKPPFKANAVFGISLDGTQKVHDKIRMKGLYKKIWDNYSNHKGTFINTTLMNSNKKEPERLVKEWSNTSVLGIFFNFATPFKNSDNRFWIPWDEREKIIDRLVKLKKEYGDFILMTRNQIESLRRKNVEKWSKNCPIRWLVKCLNSNGIQKVPCVFGENVICGKCGCFVSTVPNSVFGFDFGVINILLRLFDAQNS